MKLGKDKTKENPLTRKVRYATFNMRMMAALIDMVIIMIVGYPLCSFIDNSLFGPPQLGAVAALYANPLPPEEVRRGVWLIIKNQHLIERTIITNSLQLLLFAAYIIPCWIRYHSTPGKMAMGIEIRDATTYEFMTTKQMVKRFLGYILSSIPIALGFVWMFFNRKRQCWQDKIAHTVVVRKDRDLFSLTLRSEGQ